MKEDVPQNEFRRHDEKGILANVTPSTTPQDLHSTADTTSGKREQDNIPEIATSSFAAQESPTPSGFTIAPVPEDEQPELESQDHEQEDIKPLRLSTAMDMDDEWSVDEESSDDENEESLSKAVIGPVPTKAEWKLLLQHDSAIAAAAEDIKPDALQRKEQDIKPLLHVSTNIDLDADSSDDEDDKLFLTARSPFAAQADSKRENLLQALENEEDKALQQILWRMGFQFLLKGHQPMAVRRVAGVPPKFPLHYQDKMETLDISLCMLGLPAQPPTRGILLAGE